MKTHSTQSYAKGDPVKIGQANRLDEQDRKALALWASECAAHVLSYFEEKYSQDDRPRKAVEAGRAWARGEITMSQARIAAFAAHAAARDANDSAAIAAARSAGHAAATAHVPNHARHAATYAVKTVTAAFGGNAVEVVAERNWQTDVFVKLNLGEL